MAGELFAAGFLIVFLFTALVGVLALLGQIWATYDAFTRDDLSDEQKIVFIALFWFLPFTWIIYLFVGRERTAGFLDDLEFL